MMKWSTADNKPTILYFEKELYNNIIIMNNWQSSFFNSILCDKRCKHWLNHHVSTDKSWKTNLHLASGWLIGLFLCQNSCFENKKKSMKFDSRTHWNFPPSLSCNNQSKEMALLHLLSRRSLARNFPGSWFRTCATANGVFSLGGNLTPLYSTSWI